MKFLDFECPVKVNTMIARTLCRAAEKTGRTIYIRKNKKNSFVCMNSIISLLWLRLRKHSKVTICCEGEDAEDVLEFMKREFETFSE